MWQKGKIREYLCDAFFAFCLLSYNNNRGLTRDKSAFYHSHNLYEWLFNVYVITIISVSLVIKVLPKGFSITITWKKCYAIFISHSRFCDLGPTRE